MHIDALLKNTLSSLESAGSDTPRLDAELLLAHVLHCTRAHLYAHSQKVLSEAEIEKFQSLLNKRLKGNPIAYLLGSQEFWSLSFQVNAHTLVPRADTECLVELALSLGKAEDSLAVADLGTGSGAIAIALAHERPHWKIVATDQSSEALKVAEKNAVHLLTSSSINFYQGSWCAALPAQKFDMIISNPPYLSYDDPHLQKIGVCQEPQTALVSGKSGLEDIEHIIQEARPYLTSSGYLLLEHGAEQSQAVYDLFFSANYQNIYHKNDLNQKTRITYAMFA